MRLSQFQQFRPVYAMFIATFVVAGCATTPEKPTTVNVPKSSMASAAASHSVQRLEKGALGYAIIPNLQTSLKSAHSIISQFEPGTPPEEVLTALLLEEVATTAGLKGTTGIDLKRPMFALFISGESESQRPSPVWLLPTKGKDAFLDMIEGETADVKGNAFGAISPNSQDGEYFINFSDNYAAISNSASAYQAHKVSLDRLLSAKPTAGDLIIGIEVSQIKKTYGALFKNVMGQLQPTKMEPASRGGTGLMEGESVAAFEAFEGIVEGIDRAEFVVSLKTELVSVYGVMTLKKGSTFQTFMDAQPLGNLEPLKRISSDNLSAAGVIVADMKAADGAFINAISSMALPIYPPEIQKLPAFSKALEDILTLTTGRSATVFHGDSLDKSTKSFSVTDSVKFRRVTKDLAEILGDPLFAEQIRKKNGIIYNYEHAVMTIKDVPVDKHAVSYDYSAMNPMVASMMQKLTKPSVIHTACLKNHCFQVTNDDDPETTLTKIMDEKRSKPAGKHPSIERASSRALPHPLAFGYLTYTNLEALFSALPVTSNLTLFDKLPESEGIDFSVGGDSKHFEFKLNLPLK